MLGPFARSPMLGLVSAVAAILISLSYKSLFLAESLILSFGQGSQENRRVLS